MRTFRTLLLALAIVTLLPACTGGRKNQRIPRGPQSEAVLELLESYRHAMEARDVDAILSLTSPDYLDGRGSLDPSDDLDRAGLKAKLEAEMARITALKLSLEVLKLEFDEGKEVAALELRYDLRFQLEMPAGSSWHNEINVHQMKLRREEAGWRVIGGL
ncbi:MAG: hypothetical protein P1V51_20310 [Deltaproteobacteria bacterium]|nr:hypothetical protein [Deltaproteobacteria bacterium]